MAKPFRIHVNSISAQPLSAEQTATKYGVSSDELRRVRLFVIKRDSSQGRLIGGKSAAARAKKSGSGRRNSGHK